eukprot:825761-Pelagomonas_calceolata.AAC.3
MLYGQTRSRAMHFHLCMVTKQAEQSHRSLRDFKGKTGSLPTSYVAGLDATQMLKEGAGGQKARET